MRLLSHLWSSAGCSVLWALALRTLPAVDVSPAPGYYDHIKPLLSVHCHQCHDGEKQKGDLRLDLAEAARRGGKSGKPAVVPGRRSDSEVWRRLTTSDPDERMPPEGPGLTPEQVELIGRWIDLGAPWPAQDDWWAFQPLKPPGMPPTIEGQTAGHPVDAFIDTRLRAAGITAMPAADRRTLLRRVYADLIGMPPTPEEAERFLRDERADAYERLIDRLLADPRYGERWARHWLDLARYGESDGYEDDKVRPLAWRYRDYVVRSLNADKPYDRFIQEQIAGDELWPDDADAWIATGFARLGAWDGMSKIPEQQRQDFLNDATDVVGSVVLGVTLGCARCHDHKYDPISQQDYFRIQAFFAGVKRETRSLPRPPVEPPEVTAAFARERTELERLTAERDALVKRARLQAEQDHQTALSAAVQAENKTSDENKTTPPKPVDDETVRAVADRLEPGRREQLAHAITALEKSIRFHRPEAEVVCASDDTPTTWLLRGGELARRGPAIVPGFIHALVPPGSAVAATIPSPRQRRSVLARWLTTPEHPLTARVLVNRLWQHHFGSGLVSTASDFGRNGQPPSHPQLLDWLATRFMAEGWRLKPMHRLLMTSAAYQRSSEADPLALQRDPQNRLRWRMDRRRLDAEAIRDTLLAVAGRLEPAMGGPGVYAKLPTEVNVQFPNNDKELSWGIGSEADNRRRSLYLFQRRTLTFPLIEVFDGAPMNQSCAVRASTTVAPQALALFNGEFARTTATHFAARLRRRAGEGDEALVAQAFLVAFQRRPTTDELRDCTAFLQRQRQVRAEADLALVDFCHVLLNTNELIHID